MIQPMRIDLIYIPHIVDSIFIFIFKTQQARYRPPAATISREMASFRAPEPILSASPALPPLARYKSSITDDL